MANSKRERFARIFPKRAGNIREQLRILGNCSNKMNYEWDPDKVNLFFAYILQEMITTSKSFGIDMNAEVGGKDVNEY